DSAGGNRPASRIYALGPIQFLHERCGLNELAIDPVENIEKAIPVSLYQQMKNRSVLLYICQHGGFIGVVVIQIVRGELEVPFQLSRIGVERKNAIRIEVVARAGFSHKIRRRIAGCPVQSVE